jgi:hypothetical protein
MSTPVTDTVQHLHTLIADPLHVARTAARGGARVIGYLGSDVPVALIAASGALPLRLRGVAGADTTHADRYLESAYSPESRAVAEQWLRGELDFIDAVVFPRTDDSAQRLYYYLCELQRRGLCAGPRPLLFDVANLARPMSAAYTRESTHRLAQELGTSGSALGPALSRLARREMVAEQVREHRAACAPLAGSLAWAWERVSACDWREEFDALTLRWLAGSPRLSASRRLLLAGDPSPDGAVHRAIEAAGGSVVMDLTECLPDTPPAPTANIDSVADHVGLRRNPVLAMRENPDWVVACARGARADAVLFWLIEEDESMPWEIARQMRLLDAAGIPALLLSRQPWQAGEAPLSRVQEFVATLQVAP